MFTVAGVAGAIFFNSGQVCVAGSRLYAHKSVFDDVIEGMTKTADFWAPRPSLDPAALGPPDLPLHRLEAPQDEVISPEDVDLVGGAAHRTGPLPGRMSLRSQAQAFTPMRAV